MQNTLILSLTFFFIFFSSFIEANEGTGSPLSKTVYYPPVDVEKTRQTEPVFRARTTARTVDSGVNTDLFGTLLSDPVGAPDLEIKKQLKEILETSRKESSQKASQENPVVTEEPQTSQENILSSSGVSTTTSPGSAVLIAMKITPDDEPGSFVAKLENGSYVGVTKTTDGYYDQHNRKVVLKTDEQTGSATGEVAPINNIFLIILAFGSTFAAIFIGFIAWDNQRRLEEAIVSQNQRLVGSGSSSFTDDHDPMEPETFSFSTDGVSGSSFGSFDSETSFRTIA